MNNEVKKGRLYSVYEVPDLELWLEEMAAEGLLLSRLGVMHSYFEKAEPQERYYRVVDIPNSVAAEELSRYEEQGWYEICKEGTYHILYGRKEDQPDESRIRNNQKTRLLRRWRMDSIVNLVVGVVFFLNIILLITPGHPYGLEWFRIFTNFDNFILYIFCVVLNGIVFIKRWGNRKQMKTYIDNRLVYKEKRRPRNEAMFMLRNTALYILIGLFCIYGLYAIFTSFTEDSDSFYLKDIPNMVTEEALGYPEGEEYVSYYDNVAVLDCQYLYYGEFDEELYILNTKIFSNEFMESLLLRRDDISKEEIKEVTIGGLDQVYVGRDTLGSGQIVARKGKKVLYLESIEGKEESDVLEEVVKALNRCFFYKLFHYRAY